MAFLLVIMGPAGSGKSAVAAAVASELELQLLEADDFHSAENIAHMSSGQPLTDAMREPWISALEQALLHHSGRGENIVLAYSGLRRAHRARIRACAEHCLFLDLQVPADALQARLENRRGHFMNATMLPSQLASMEAPDDAEPVIPVDASGPLQAVIARALTIAEEALP